MDDYKDDVVKFVEDLLNCGVCDIRACEAHAIIKALEEKV